MTGRYQEYPEYNKSGSKWLDEVPSGWKVTALKHVLDTPITDGPHSTPTFLDEGIPFVSAEAVSGGYINFNKIRGHISEEDDVFFSQKYRPQKHDVYMVKSGATTGITAIVETDKRFNIWSPLAVMRCKDTYNPYFLLNYLRSDTFQKSVQLSWTFGTQQNIGMNILENLTVCYPPFEEQQKIANFLDHETAKIDTLITKQEKLIELLKEKRQAVISHAVTRGIPNKEQPNVPMKDSGVEWLGEVPSHWKTSKLKNYTTKIVDGAHFTPTYTETGVPFLRVTDVTSKTIDFNKIKYIPESEHKDLIKRCNPQKGDLLLSKNGTIGVPKVIDWDYEFSVFVSLCLIKFKPELSSKYAFYVFKSYQIAEQINSGIKQSTVINLHLDKIENFYFLIPPIEEQNQIILELERKTLKLDTLVNKAIAVIELMKERKTALISAAVTGKIDVRDWNINNDQ